MRKVLSLLFALLVCGTQLMAQSRTVTGKVTDETGAPVVGASVVPKGAKTGATTNANGVFSVVVPAGIRQITISSIGFETVTATVGTSDVLDVSLKATVSELTDVVVTGYTRVKKSEYVGAASKIDKKAIELVPVGSFDQILQGRAPGLRVTAGSGQPGSAASIQIRGPKSISGGSTPLFIVDGVPVEQSVFQSYNPNDFETVDILKDASSAALYGSRGASGVIVVTTKRGKKGATSFSYRPQIGFTQPGTQQFEMMNSEELLRFQEQLGAKVNNNLPGWFFSRRNPANASLPATVLAGYDRTLDSLRGINTNWVDIFQRQGRFQAHDLSLSGGTDRTRFFASGSYYDEQGIGERSDMKRYTLRTNIDHSTDKFTFQFSSTFGYTKRNFIESENAVALANPFAAAYLALPYHRLFLEDGRVDVGAGKVGPNAYQRIRDIQRYNDQIKNTTSMNFNYDFTKNFFGGANVGFDFRETQNTTFLQPNTFTAIGGGNPAAGGQAFPSNTGSYNDGLSRFLQVSGRGFFGYKGAFGKEKEHKITFTANAEQILQRTKSFGFTGFGINEKLPNTPAAITPGTVDNRLIAAVSGNKSERAYVSAFGMLKYAYSDRYVLDLTIRRDGASNIPEVNRFQNFYAAGFLWNTLNEKFARNWKVLSTLRMRLSYGTSANAENFPFGDFGYFPLYGGGSYAGFQTLVPTTPGNPVGDWEYTDKFNLGIEFGLWNERLYGEVNVYNEITRNLFITQNIPAENGGAFTSAQVNAGKMRNRGVELNLNFDVIRSRNFTWSVGGNFGYNDNEILSLGQESEFPQGTAIVRVGLPLGSHYVNRWGGVDAATGAPLYYTKDGKLTNVFSSNDQVAEFGTFFAPWTGGFNTSVKFKGFDVAAFFNFQAKFSRFNNQDFFQLNHAFAISGYNLRKEMLNMWDKPGDVTDIQSPVFQRQFSSKDIQDASYLRFRNLLIGYTMPASSLSKTNVIKGLRFYVQAQNLFTFTRWTGFDPEDNNNIAQYEYPLPRTYTFGVNLDF
ncbi:MAG TPA: SusC/RagA family TonB-linked outer membrane protein [Lacibacter sp.]|nr:SusC/RagA family TonB-linked outer membrane protein [Lacibacter sp.]HMO88075.1 SusC/RagA family TonB-linked outer membrane protein [Lacibacter sp.]